jgi:hypothetical protein
MEFIEHHSSINTNYFNGQLDFKLHYHDLRQVSHPDYKSLGDKRFSLIDEIFEKIISTHCSLLSVTINKESHCDRYDDPVNPRGYALWIMLERFQYFLVDNHRHGEVIFERYNSKMRKMVERVHDKFNSLTAFPKPVDFENVDINVKNGDPLLETVLQYAYFFAYVPYIKSTNNLNCRYNQLTTKYYNFDGHPFTRGNVEL